MKKLLILAAAAAVGLTSCSKEDGARTHEGGEVIEFRGVVEKTRASLTDTDFRSFFVSAFRADEAATFGFLNASVYKNGAAWEYAPEKYWPIDGTAVSFFAYAPVKDVNMTTPLATDGTFGYTVPADQSNNNHAADLLVASDSDVTATSNGGAVVLEFDHALSAVNFTAENLSTNPAELMFTVRAAELVALNTVGTYTYGTGWSALGTPLDYKSSVRNTAVGVGETEQLLSTNDFLMVLPQVVDPATQNVKITFSVKDGEGQYIYEDAELVLDFPAGFEFVAGKRYNFTFTFDATSNGGLLNPIMFTVTLNDWEDETPDPEVTPVP